MPREKDFEPFKGYHRRRIIDKFFSDEELESEEEDISSDDVEEGKGLAILAYVPFLCLIPYLQGKEENRFAYQHARQGVILFLIEIIAVISALFWKVALFLVAIAAIAGVVNVLRGKTWKIPLIGNIPEKLDI